MTKEEREKRNDADALNIFPKKSRRAYNIIMKDKNEITLKFMEVAIDRINTNSATIYAIEQALIEKGVITQNELVSKIAEAKNLPEQKVGEKILKEMVEQFKKEQSHAS
jgi:hypothetical protein